MGYCAEKAPIQSNGLDGLDQRFLSQFCTFLCVVSSPPFGISVFSLLVAPRVSCTSLCLSVWVVSGVHVFTPCSVSCLIL